jgi:hypothetical protein
LVAHLSGNPNAYIDVGELRWADGIRSYSAADSYYEIVHSLGEPREVDPAMMQFLVRMKHRKQG